MFFFQGCIIFNYHNETNSHQMSIREMRHFSAINQNAKATRSTYRISYCRCSLLVLDLGQRIYVLLRLPFVTTKREIKPPACEIVCKFIEAALARRRPMARCRLIPRRPTAAAGQVVSEPSSTRPDCGLDTPKPRNQRPAYWEACTYYAGADVDGGPELSVLK
jgi:hypothetical protein